MTDTSLETGDPTAIERVATSTDANILGRYWLTTGTFALLMSLVAGVLVSLERFEFDGSQIFGSADEFFQFWSAHRVGLVLLAVLPMLLGLGIAVAPAQVGSSCLVFPRMAAFSFWTWFTGAGITITGFLIDGGLGSPNAGGQREAVALTLMGLLMVIGGLIGSTISLLTTIMAARVPGLTLKRIPLFSWTLLVSGTIWILSLPVLAANILLVYVDLRGRPAVRFGMEDAIWEQISWISTHPQIYAFSLPLIGIVFDILPVSLNTRLKRHDVILVLTGFFGVVSFGAYAQTFFDTPGTPVMSEALYVVQAFAAAILVFAVFGGVAETLRFSILNRGAASRNRVPPPMVLSLLALLLLLIAVLGGALRVIGSLDLLNTSATGAQMTLTMGATLVGTMAGVFWWSEIIFHKKAFQGLGFLVGLSTFLAALIIGVCDFLSGFLGQSDFTGSSLVAAGSPKDPVGLFNTVAVVGSCLFLFSCLGWICIAFKRPAVATSSADTWGGHTLEWSADPLVIEVASDRPLLDLAEREEAES